MGRCPVWIAAACYEALDVEQILGGEGQTVQGPAGAPGKPNVDARHEGAEGIGHVVAFEFK